MNEDARTRTPKPPSLSHVVAVCLELGMFATFAAHRSVLGAALWMTYFYFSAFRALLSGRW